MENYKKLLKKVFNFISETNKDFESINNLKKLSVEYIKSDFFIYSDEKNLDFLKTFDSLIEEQLEKELGKKINVFYELNFSELNEELREEKILFFKKNNFNNFVFHNNNASIFQTIKNVIFDDEEINLLYMWGSEGIGKTHFICALLDKYETQFFNKQTLYISLHDFANKYYAFVKNLKTKKKFIDLFLKYDVLVFDDFQNLKDRKNIEEVICLLANESINLNKKIIFINSSKNNLSSWMSKELTSLIVAGYNLKLIDPNPKNVKIIISDFIKNQNQNLKITAETLEYLSLRLGKNLHIAINKVIKILMFFENPKSMKIIDLNELKKVLEKISIFNKSKDFINYSNNQQLKAICKQINFNAQEILSTSRKKNIVLNRNVVIYIFKKKFNFSNEYIGKIFNKNHSTVTHSLKQISKKLKEKSFNEYIEILINKNF